MASPSLERMFVFYIQKHYCLNVILLRLGGWSHFQMFLHSLSVQIL